MAADLDAERLAGESLEWGGMARRRPELQLRVAGGAELQQVVVAAIVQLETGDGLGVAAVETFRHPQNRRERTHIHDGTGVTGERLRCRPHADLEGQSSG